MILREFDSRTKPIINAQELLAPIEGMPRTLISCFAHDLVEYAVKKYKGEIVQYFHCANGAIPIYRLHIEGKSIGIVMSLVGAPAVIAEYEELFAMGVQQMLVFGTCGVLDKKIKDHAIIIPNKAIRDEGTSYHYAEYHEEITVNANTFYQMVDILEGMKIPHKTGKVWTTDAIYRETKGKRDRRKAQGCICVDMEASAIAAFAHFKNRSIAQFFYTADSVADDKWEERSLSNKSKFQEKTGFVDLALELAGRLWNINP